MAEIILSILLFETKEEYGHFEGDTIVSKDHNGMVVTLTEKKTLQEFIVPVENMDSITVANAIIEVWCLFC